MISDVTLVLDTFNMYTQQLEQLEAEYETLDRNNPVKVLSLYMRFSPLRDEALSAFKTQKVLEQVRASFQEFARDIGEEFSPSKESDALEQASVVFANRAMKFAAKLEGDINRHRGAKSQAERVQRAASTATGSNKPGVSFMPKGWLTNQRK